MSGSAGCLVWEVLEGWERAGAGVLGLCETDEVSPPFAREVGVLLECTSCGGSPNGGEGTPSKGWLIMTHARKKSGRISAHMAAVTPPKSWPIMQSTCFLPRR